MKTIWSLGHCCVLYIVFATGAWADSPWCSMYEHPLRSWVQPPVLELLDEHLGLSDAQRVHVERMTEEHSRRFAAFALETRTVMAEFDEKLRRTMVGTLERVEIELEREAALAPLADAQVQLDEQFFGGIKPVLSESQQERWDDVMHRINRWRWLKGEVFLEEPIDLVVIVEDLARAENLEVADLGVSELLTRYALELDQQLLACVSGRIAESRTWQRDLPYEHDGENAWVGQHSGGLAGFRREHRERVRLHERVRNVNRRYVEIIQANLPEEHQGAFRQAYHERVIATADFRGSRSLQFPRFIQCAAAIDELTDEQRELLDRLAIDYDLNLKQNVTELIRRHDQKVIDSINSNSQESRRILEARLEEAVNRIREQDDLAIEQLHLLLEPEQSEAIKSGAACAELRN